MRSFTASLRHKVRLEQEVRSPDGGGGFSSEWESVAVLWAAIGRVRSVEKYMYGQVAATATHVFRLRYTSSISTDMRLVFGERIFNIRGIYNPEEKNNLLEILAEEGVAA